MPALPSESDRDEDAKLYLAFPLSPQNAVEIWITEPLSSEEYERLVKLVELLDPNRGATDVERAGDSEAD